VKKAILDDIVGTAVQLAYEYEGWGCEHVYDMYEAVKTMRKKVGYTVEDLHDVAHLAQKKKDSGMKYSEAVTEITEEINERLRKGGRI